MQRNEYRRALIMLRSLLNGYSGHARMEIRTLTGNLNIRATTPQSAQSVRAALVGRRSSLYYAYPLGNLRRDMRGQAGLSVNFDPRDIGGRTLDAYSLLALVTINDGVCELALVGNLNGSCENDWSRVRDVVCALYAPQPREEEPSAAVPYAAPEPAALENETESYDGANVREGDSCPLTFMDGKDEPGEDHNGYGEDESGETGNEDEEDSGADEGYDEGLVWDFTPDDPDETETGAEAETETEHEDEFDVPDMFRQEGWSFARTALPAGCGYAYAYVGVPGCGGEICVALPGNFDTQPPVGLDDYQWIGDTGAGWWIKCYTAENSEERETY